MDERPPVAPDLKIQDEHIHICLVIEASVWADVKNACVLRNHSSPLLISAAAAEHVGQNRANASTRLCVRDARLKEECGLCDVAIGPSAARRCADGGEGRVQDDVRSALQSRMVAEPAPDSKTGKGYRTVGVGEPPKPTHANCEQRKAGARYSNELLVYFPARNAAAPHPQRVPKGASQREGRSAGKQEVARTAGRIDDQRRVIQRVPKRSNRKATEVRARKEGAGLPLVLQTHDAPKLAAWLPIKGSGDTRVALSTRGRSRELSDEFFETVSIRAEGEHLPNYILAR